MLFLASVSMLLIAHLAVIQGFLGVSTVLLTVALCNILALGICQRAKCHIILIVLGLMLVGLLLSLIDAVYLTYYPPVFINSLIFLFFFFSLFNSNTPIIERFALLVHGEISSTHRIYCRRVTIAWSIFMFLLVAETVVLALYFPIETWSLFVNLINYSLVALMFLLEFFVRKLALKNEEKMTLIEFYKSVSKIDIKKIIR